MCSKSMLPVLNEAIQNACDEFPKTASAIIEHHGLNTEEFNLLQKKLDSSFLFRHRVQKSIDQLDNKLAKSLQLQARREATNS